MAKAANTYNEYSEYGNSGNNTSGVSGIIDTETVHGGDVYRNDVRLDFSVNLNPVPMPQQVIDAAIRGFSEIHQYPDPLHQELKEKIASYEKVSADEVICGSGASELIMAVCHAFRPRKALITAPCYAGYARALAALNAETVEYRLRADNGFAIDEGFIDALTDDIDIVFIADPNNPNGKLIDAEIKRRIADTCEKRGITLVIDECFLPLTVRGLTTRAPEDMALHLRAFTKTFAIPGIRAGYMISHDTGRLNAVSRHLPEWNMSVIAGRTGEAAAEILRDTDYLDSSNSIIAEERAYLSGELADLGFRVYGSDTNYILLQGQSDLYSRLLEKGILIRKCANFSGLDETFFRIAVRTHEDNEQLTAALREILL